MARIWVSIRCRVARRIRSLCEEEELQVPKNSNVVSDQIICFPRLAREGAQARPSLLPPPHHGAQPDGGVTQCHAPDNVGQADPEATLADGRIGLPLETRKCGVSAQE